MALAALGPAASAAASPPAPNVEPPAPIVAQTPASAPEVREDGFAGGFSLERGAWLATPHIEFGIGLLTALRYGATFTNDSVDSLGFTLPYVRPNLHASVFDGKLRFVIQPEFAGPTPRLLDAELVWQPIKAFGLDLGQYRPHVSRAWNTPIPTLGLVGRGAVDDAFHSDRALGATVFGRPFDGKLEYDVGVFNAGGYNLAKPTRLEPMVTWRLAVNPIGAVPYTQTPAFAKVDKPVFGFGVHGWSDRFQPVAADPTLARPLERQRVTAGGDFVVMTPRVHVLLEGFGRWHVAKRGLLDAGWGSQGQVGVMVLDETLELQARAGVMDPGLGVGMQGTWEGGLSWYLFGNHVKAQLHYACTQSLADVQGCNHRAELQTQLWF